MNAKVGAERYQNVTGSHGLGELNVRGERLLEFCEVYYLGIANTWFEHPSRRKYTWRSPGDICRNQIDFIMIKNRFRNSIKQCKTYPGADIGSDHNPVVAKIQIKLKKVQSTQQPKSRTYDVAQLQSSDFRSKYTLEVKNRYEVLMNETLEQYSEETPNEKIENKWLCLKNSIKQTNHTCLLPKERKARKPWMTDEILNMMDQRRALKNTDTYQEMDNKISNECRKAKEK
jgi:hypothetical protein